jgi:hypothetical protein
MPKTIPQPDAARIARRQGGSWGNPLAAIVAGQRRTGAGVNRVVKVDLMSTTLPESNPRHVVGGI